MKTTKEMIDIFRSRFCNGRHDAYGTYYLDKGRYCVIKEPVDEKVILKHLQGVAPLGVFMLKGDATSVAVVDVDRPDTPLVDKIVKQAEQVKLHSYVELSKGKGYHVWIFFEEAVPARLVRRCVQSLLIPIGADDIEVFPKQDNVKPGEFGNFVNCPLFGKHVQEGKTVFVDSNFKPYADQWDFLKTIKPTPRSVLDTLLIRLNEQWEEPQNQNCVKETREASATASRTFGLPVCSTRMLNEGVKSMQRSAAFRLGVALKMAGLPFKSTVSVLREWAKRNKPFHGKGVITPEEIEYQVTCSYRKPYVGCGCNDPASHSLL